METIPQLDSKLEETLDSAQAQEVLFKLYTENVQLRNQLKEMNKKLDDAINVEPKVRSLSRKRMKTQKLPNKKPVKVLSEKFLKSKTSNNHVFERLEAKVEELENLNANYRRSVDINYLEILSPEVKPLFEKCQKYFRLIFKAECVIFKTQKEIQENAERIHGLTTELINFTANSPNQKASKAFFPQEVHKIDPKKPLKQEKLDILKEKEQFLRGELEFLQETLKSKQIQIKALGDMQVSYTKEMQSLMKLKNANTFMIRRAFSPSPSKIKRVVSPEEIVKGPGDQRNRPRFYSNTPMKPREHQEITRKMQEKRRTEPVKYSELKESQGEKLDILRKRLENNLKPEQNQVKYYEKIENSKEVAFAERFLLKNSEFEAFSTFGPSSVFKSVKLNPGDFEFTYNFTREAQRLNENV